MDFSRYMIDVSTMFSGKCMFLTIAEILAPEHGNSNNSTSSPKYLINELNQYLAVLSWATTIIILPMTFYVQLCLYNWFAYMMYFTMIGLNITINQIDAQEKDCDIY